MKNTSRTFLYMCIALVLGAGIGVLVAGAGANSQSQSVARYPIDLSLAGQHRHDLLMVPAEDAPSVSIDVMRDSMMPGNFNVRIDTENFTFAPENISEEHVLGEGHAHVFVDDVKISRAYGQWYHLPRLKPGEHIIKVTLNTNDHREYATEENFIIATETVTVSEDGSMNMQMGTTGSSSETMSQ